LPDAAEKPSIRAESDRRELLEIIRDGELGFLISRDRLLSPLVAGFPLA
jgi:hypothetical protein